MTPDAFKSVTGKRIGENDDVSENGTEGFEISVIVGDLTLGDCNFVYGEHIGENADVIESGTVGLEMTQFVEDCSPEGCNSAVGDRASCNDKNSEGCTFGGKIDVCTEVMGDI